MQHLSLIHICTPDESYHGITYAERFGKEGAFITKATAQLMRDFGSMQSPMNAYMPVSYTHLLRRVRMAWVVLGSSALVASSQSRTLRCV